MQAFSRRAWCFDVLFAAFILFFVGLPDVNSTLWVPFLAGFSIFVVGYAMLRPRIPMLIHNAGLNTAGHLDLAAAGLLTTGTALAALGHNQVFTGLLLTAPLVWTATNTYTRGLVWNIALVALTSTGMALHFHARHTFTSMLPTVLFITIFAALVTTLFGTIVHTTLNWGRERSELLTELHTAHTQLRTTYQQLLDRPPSTEPLPSPLTSRETEILTHIRDGLTNREIATSLYLSLSTVKTHIERILAKLNATSRTHAVAIAHEERLFPAATTTSDTITSDE
jgi:DNA-binding CsgD family transcriptional regulator